MNIMTTEAFKEAKKEIDASINLIPESEYKPTLYAICNSAAKIVKRTLGPYASTTVLDDGTGTYSTKDGWTVLNHLQFNNPVHNVMYDYLKRISFNVNTRVGDGTTTALAVADHFLSEFNEIMEKINTSDVELLRYNVRQADVIAALEEVKDEIIERLRNPNHCKRISDSGKDETFDDIYKIAYVSSNGNKEIATIIRDIYKQTRNPNIHVTLSDTDNTYYSINRGYRLDCKLMLAPLYLGGESELIMPNGAQVFIFDHMVKYSEHFGIIQWILDNARNHGTTACIFAPNYDDPFLSTITSAIREAVRKEGSAATLNVMLFQMPITNQALKNYMFDFAAITGAEIVNYTKVRMFNFLLRNNADETREDFADFYGESEEFKATFPGEYCVKPSEILGRSLGNAYRMTSTEKYVLIEEYPKDTPMYQASLKVITEEFEAEKNKLSSYADPLNRNYMEAHLRYVKFIGDTGMIFVGGDSTLKKNCSKDAVQDATLACRSAFENGYIRGLNLETISSILEIIPNPEAVKSVKDILRFYICEGLLRAFTLTSIDVMLNKIEKDSEYAKEYKWGDHDRVSSDAVKLSEMYFASEKSTMINSIGDAIEVLMHAGMYKLGYNVISEKFSSEPDVINSVETDIEILRSVTSIIGLLVSSNQLLSINKHYDKKANERMTLEAAEKMSEAQTQGIFNVLNQSSFYQSLRSIAILKKAELDNK